MARKVFQMRTTEETEAAITMLAAHHKTTKTKAVKQAIIHCVNLIIDKQLKGVAR